MKSGFSTFAILFFVNYLCSQAYIDPKISSYKSNEVVPVVVLLKKKADISKVKP